MTPPPDTTPPPPTGTCYWAELAWVDGAVEPGTVLTTDPATGLFTAVDTRVPTPPPGSRVLRGLTLPGLANAHSHAFHRALRGLVQAGSGTFWTWRRTMYQVAQRLTPDSYHTLARAVFAEMALAGVTVVGEFHYLHHAPDGTPYADPHAMAHALLVAAEDAGVRLTLLDTCYLTADLRDATTGAPLTADQRRFSDGTAESWAERAAQLHATATGPTVRVGAAIHSVRAVPAAHLGTVADWARERGTPLHLHLSEQPAENETCHAVHGRSPTRLLADHGVLGPHTTAVHATHLDPEDIALLGGTHTGVCLCPTTERDLADGIGPAAGLRQAGSPLSLGSDSHAVIDLLAEARAVEEHERLRTGHRGHFTAAQLLAAATTAGYAALGWPEAGRLAVGAPADFTTLALDTVRTAGPPPRLAAETAVHAATAAEVRHTVVGGEPVVWDGVHQRVEDVPRALAEAIGALDP